MDDSGALEGRVAPVTGKLVAGGRATPMTEQWGIPSHLTMPPAAVAETARTLPLLYPSSSVPEMQTVPRPEPNVPRRARQRRST